MVPSFSIVSTASLTSRMTVTMEACGGKKEEIRFEIQSLKGKIACIVVAKGLSLISAALFIFADNCQFCL